MDFSSFAGPAIQQHHGTSKSKRLHNHPANIREISIAARVAHSGQRHYT
jgi:hypothetical protein